MTCSRTQNLLSAYIDQELNKDDFFKIRTHLTTCSVCNKAYEELREIKGLFNNMDTAEPPENLWINIRTTILTGDLIAETNKPQSKPWWQVAFNFAKVIVPAAVIGIIIAIPVVSKITGIDVASRFFNQTDTKVADVPDNTVTTPDKDVVLFPNSTSVNSNGYYTPVLRGNKSMGNLETFDLNESSIGLQGNPLSLGYEDTGIFNDIITFFDSNYEFSIEIEIIR